MPVEAITRSIRSYEDAVARSRIETEALTLHGDLT